jgi:hypothetical protein
MIPRDPSVPLKNAKHYYFKVFADFNILAYRTFFILVISQCICNFNVKDHSLDVVPTLLYLSEDFLFDPGLFL